MGRDDDELKFLEARTAEFNRLESERKRLQRRADIETAISKERSKIFEAKHSGKIRAAKATGKFFSGGFKALGSFAEKVTRPPERKVVRRSVKKRKKGAKRKKAKSRGKRRAETRTRRWSVAEDLAGFI